MTGGTVHRTGRFHRYHTDESTLIESAALIDTGFMEIRCTYGKAPMYLLWGCSRILSAVTDQRMFDFQDNASTRCTYLLARALSASMGIATLLLVFGIGKTLGGHGQVFPLPCFSHSVPDTSSSPTTIPSIPFSLSGLY